MIKSTLRNDSGRRATQDLSHGVYHYKKINDFLALLHNMKPEFVLDHIFSNINHSQILDHFKCLRSCYEDLERYFLRCILNSLCFMKE